MNYCTLSLFLKADRNMRTEKKMKGIKIFFLPFFFCQLPHLPYGPVPEENSVSTTARSFLPGREGARSVLLGSMREPGGGV